MKTIRSLLSLLAGYLTFALAMVLLWMAFGHKPKDVPPDGFLLFSIFCECFFAIGGGVVAAKIANRKELAHTGILTGIFAFFLTNAKVSTAAIDGTEILTI